MLPVRDEAGGKVAGWSFAATLALVAVSLLPTLIGISGVAYALAAGAAGAMFLWRAAAFFRAVDRDQGARRLFLFSLAYLPLLLGMLLVDRLLLSRP
jgi:protoheme IX farnesyltransferase